MEARGFWKALCAEHMQGDRTLRGFDLRPHRSGLELELRLGAGPVKLLIQPAGAGKSYARTPSFSISILVDTQLDALPSTTDRSIRALCDAARRADTGEIPLPNERIAPAPPKSPKDASTIRRAHDARTDRLHYAAFVAYKALVTEDLYPHVAPLGREVPEEEIHEGWQDTLQRLRAGRAPEKLGLYIHVPYCAVACTFCYCGKTDQFDRRMRDDYVDRLCEEAERFAPLFTGHRFTSVYVGGGTPSILPAPAMERLFRTVYESFDVPRGTQVIFEGNPDSLSPQKIEVLARYGRVTRLTIGVQSLDPEVQRRVRRHNKPEMVKDALEAARRFDIPHVNLDMMAGLPAQTMESFERDMRFLLSLRPDSLHINEFRPLPRVGLVLAGDSRSDDDPALRDQMLVFGRRMLAEDGLVSLLQQEPHRTEDAANLQEYDLRRQNSSLLGLGFPSRAHSFANHYYAPDQTRGFDSSLRSELRGKRTWRAIRVDEQEEVHKFMVTNVRSGFSVSEFRKLFGKSPERAAPKAFEDLGELGVMEIEGDQVKTHVENHVDALIYRAFMYSDAQLERIRAVWGAEYDRKVDWKARLERLMGTSD